MFPRTAFYFLRHGETDWNLRRVMQGHTDTPLNETGIAQAARVAALVAELPIKTICCSPLQRARRTAELVNARRAPLVVIDELKECGFGIHEGQPADGGWRAEWLKGAPIPGGETLDAYVARVCGGLSRALAQPGPILVVAHGGTFWAIERHALNNEKVRVGNCALFELTPAETGAWRVRQLDCGPSP